MDIHELADIFPKFSDEELKELCADIDKNGLAEPVTVYEGKILDGRNRWEACAMLGIEPKTVEYTGNDPISFVLSKNLHRRHLNESQRAMVAAELANMRHGGDRKGEKNQAANLRLDPKEESIDCPTSGKVAENSESPENLRKVNKENATQNDAISQSAAAKMLNVSERQVQNAAKLRREAAPEVVEQVKRGEKSIHAALSKQPPAKQPSRRKTVAKESEPDKESDEIVETEQRLAEFYEMCVGKKPEKFLKIPYPHCYAIESKILCVCYGDGNDELKRRVIEETEKLGDALYELTHPE